MKKLLFLSAILLINQFSFGQKNEIDTSKISHHLQKLNYYQIQKSVPTYSGNADAFIGLYEHPTKNIKLQRVDSDNQIEINLATKGICADFIFLGKKDDPNFNWIKKHRIVNDGIINPKEFEIYFDYNSLVILSNDSLSSMKIISKCKAILVNSLHPRGSNVEVTFEKAISNSPKLLIQTNAGRSYTNTTVLANQHLPHYEVAGYLTNFVKAKDSKWRSLNQISLVLNGLIFNQGAYSVEPDQVAFTSSNNTISGIQQYQLPGISELVEYSKISASLDINIINYKHTTLNGNSGGFNFNVGYNLMSTPLSLQPATELVGKSLKDINGIINDLQAQIDNTILPPNDNADIQRQIGELLLLSDYLQVIPKNIQLDNLGDLNKSADMIQKFVSGSISGYIHLDRMTLQAYSKLSLPLNNLAVTQSIYQVSTSTLDTNLFENFSQLTDTLNIKKIESDQLNALSNQLTPIFSSGIRIDYKISNSTGLFTQLQFVNPWNTGGRSNNALISFTLGLSSNLLWNFKRK